MSYIASPLSPRNREERRRLARARRIAKCYGFRILLGHPGWSLVDANTQRGLVGCFCTSLARIEAALSVPPPRTYVHKAKPIFEVVSVHIGHGGNDQVGNGQTGNGQTGNGQTGNGQVGNVLTLSRQS